MDILSKLFASTFRVKVLRLFYLNPDSVFTAKEVAGLARIPFRAAFREMRLLAAVGFLKKGARVDEIVRKSKKAKRDRVQKKRVLGLILSQTFPLLLALRYLVITASPISREEMLRYFKGRGGIKLIALGGIFIDDYSKPQGGALGLEFADRTMRLDLLIVGNSVKKSVVERFIGKLSSEVGKELVWALMPISEFDYRMAMHDRLLRDLFDFPHEFLINKLGVE